MPRYYNPNNHIVNVSLSTPYVSVPVYPRTWVSSRLPDGAKQVIELEERLGAELVKLGMLRMASPDIDTQPKRIIPHDVQDAVTKAWPIQRRWFDAPADAEWTDVNADHYPLDPSKWDYRVRPRPTASTSVGAVLDAVGKKESGRQQAALDAGASASATKQLTPLPVGAGVGSDGASTVPPTPQPSRSGKPRYRK